MATARTEPDFESFQRRFEDGQSQLVWQWITADLDTPVSGWLKLCHSNPYSFLLESVEGGAVLGRYSAIGLDPDLFWRYANGRAEISTDNKKWNVETSPALESLKKAVKESRIDYVAEDMPPMAASGLFGYLGYDMIRLVEAIPDENADELKIPDGLMIRPTLMVIFDNVRSMICVATPVRGGSGSAKTAYDAASAQIAAAVNKLQGNIPAGALEAETALETPLPAISNFTREKYHSIVHGAIEYIKAGDIFQVVPSQRFTAPFDLPPLALYRSLRRLNPSPFLFYLNFDNFALVGSSPEILVRVRKGVVTIRPIAGTRPRGATAAEDKKLADELLADPKERAEHLMLLDLARNDVGRVAEIGSVSVTDQFTIEHYSHVMHIVSNVEGRKRSDVDSLDALFAGFPAGTVSGAPKIRAMEIIDELETVRRGFYGGCVGYLDGNGDVDTCIALRTALVKDGKLYVQAGGGVVADSDPEAEYQETINKSRALLRAADMAVDDAVKRAGAKKTGTKA
ncbi:MAG TPA: anthranilate synthase component I [Patescibacteria group bacterium]|nr:anthranilate synthase component I [Patescibacteria group bacterium]